MLGVLWAAAAPVQTIAYSHLRALSVFSMLLPTSRYIFFYPPGPEIGIRKLELFFCTIAAAHIEAEAATTRVYSE